MAKYKEWFWELLEKGKGPDFFFSATFQEGCGHKLKTLVDKNLPNSYTLNTGFIESLCNRLKTGLVYENYIDKSTYDKSGQAWFHAEIKVRDNQISMLNIYGFSFGGETDLIVALVESKDLNLIKWEINYTDFYWGCQSGTLVSGTTASSLLSYLTDSKNIV
jgi:hypothetical protein